MTKIARINGREPFTGIFDRESDMIERQAETQVNRS